MWFGTALLTWLTTLWCFLCENDCMIIKDCMLSFIPVHIKQLKTYNHLNKLSLFMNIRICNEVLLKRYVERMLLTSRKMVTSPPNDCSHSE